MITILSIVLVLALSGLAYFIYRAYTLAGLLAEEQEYVETLELTNEYMYGQIVNAYDSMKQIDRLGAFEQDDEAGTTFALLKQTIEELKYTFEDGAQEEK